MTLQGLPRPAAGAAATRRMRFLPPPSHTIHTHNVPPVLELVRAVRAPHPPSCAGSRARMQCCVGLLSGAHPLPHCRQEQQLQPVLLHARCGAAVRRCVPRPRPRTGCARAGAAGRSSAGGRRGGTALHPSTHGWHDGVASPAQRVCQRVCEPRLTQLRGRGAVFTGTRPATRRPAPPAPPEMQPARLTRTRARGRAARLPRAPCRQARRVRCCGGGPGNSAADRCACVPGRLCACVLAFILGPGPTPGGGRVLLQRAERQLHRSRRTTPATPARPQTARPPPRTARLERT